MTFKQKSEWSIGQAIMVICGKNILGTVKVLR